MKLYWVVEVQLHAFLTSALDGDEWSASHAGRFTSRETIPGTQSRSGRGSEEKNSQPLQGL
jgi:hypothetical protein